VNQKKESDEEILKRVSLLAVSLLFIATLFKLDSLLVVHHEMCNLCADTGSLFEVGMRMLKGKSLAGSSLLLSLLPNQLFSFC
jgi:hypothetical protein